MAMHFFSVHFGISGNNNLTDQNEDLGDVGEDRKDTFRFYSYRQNL